MRTSITVKDQKAIDKLNKLQSKVWSDSQQIATVLARNVQVLAKSLAPHWSGKTRNLIAVYQRPTPKGSIATVLARNPTANDGHTRNIKNFNLVRWMHTTGRGQAHIKSGDPTFMWSAAEIVRRDKKRIAEHIIKR